MADEQIAEPRRGGGGNSKLWVIGILAALMVVLFIQNSQEVNFDFLFLDIQASLFFALLTTAGLGFGLGWLIARLRRRDD